MKRALFGVVFLCLASAAASAPVVTIYFIDVEGGQSTLIVTPDRQALLVDAGYAGNGGRDPDRILAAAKDAGVTAIADLFITHFHGDHVGGVPELAARLPIKTFVDYGQPSGADVNALAPFKAYAAVRASGTHLVPKPGDRLPFGAVTIDVVSTGGATMSRPFAGAGMPNSACASYERHADDTTENARSLGIRLAFGRFRFLDLGDLNWNPLGRLACPNDLIGRVDLFLAPHHTNVDAIVPAMLSALAPRAIVSNNGATKGGSREALALVHRLAGADVWQLHKSTNDGATNADETRLANVDDGKTGYWIKVVASGDGSFTVTNSRTGTMRSYKGR